MSSVNQGDRKDTLGFPTGKLSHVTRAGNVLRALLEDEADIELVQAKAAVFEGRAEAFLGHLKDMKLQPGLDEDQKVQIDLYMIEKERLINEYRAEYNEWTKSHQQQQSDAIRPADSISNVEVNTVLSQSSSVLRMKMEAAQTRAKLVIEHEFLEQKRKLEEEEVARRRENEDHQIVIRRQKEDLELQAKSRMQAALDEVLREHELRKSTTSSHHSQVKHPSCGLEEQQSELREESQLSSILKEQMKTTQMLIAAQNRSTLPRQELEYFDGQDLTRFRSFLQGFQRLVESRTSDPVDKLYYLEQYTRGDPRELVRTCTHLDPAQGFTTAMDLLQQKYGNEYRISSAFLRKLDEWPAMRTEDAIALEQFSVFLSGCSVYADGVGTLNQLQSPREIQRIAQKLPVSLQRSWRSHSYDLIEQKGVVCFKDLTQFIDRQARILTNPVFNQIRDNKTFNKLEDKFGERQVPTKQGPTFKKSIAFATSSKAEENKSSSSALLIKCPFCKKSNHELNGCFFFKKKSVKERSEFVKTKNLCFGCLQPGHTSKGCLHRMKCEVQGCDRNHPTCLHQQENQATEVECQESTVPPKESFSACCIEESVQSLHTGAGTRKVAVALLPVKVKVRGGKKVITTYAGLDNFCSDCFISEALMDQLGIRGQDTQISLTTMERKNSLTPTSVVAGLEILDMDENEVIGLPACFSRPELPISRRDVTSREDIEEFEYLKQVPFQFADADVGLMIGINAPDVLKPLEVVSGEQAGPYASRHKLGWALNGPLNVSDAADPNVFAHRVKIENYEDLDVKIQAVLDQDFQDCHSTDLGPSVEDERWLKKVQASLQRGEDKHFEVKLPFKDENVFFPDNRSQALQRLENVRRRLEKDESFRNDYCDFMQMMEDKGFMEPVPKQELITCPGQRWYIVHHGVYHRQKLKLRIVFHCSLKYRGTSLNDQLLQGPDLTNNLVGVLLRFRQGSVAFMADIEKMYYQVKVPKEHRDFLRFFWFPDGQVNQEPVEYRLSVHVFGAKSSPSIANFALQESVKVQPCSDQVAKTIMKSFYVDDLLQSVDDEEEASRLIKDIRMVCEECGFNLTQFVSNSRVILDELPVERKAQNVQVLDLKIDDLPEERALGVKWNVETDCLSYKIKIKDHQYTRRGILSMMFSVYDPLSLASPSLIPAKRIFQELCRLKLSWDEPIPSELEATWKKWIEELPMLCQYEVPRCYKPKDFKASDYQLHIFCDASEVAFGAVAYLRAIDGNRIHCSLVKAKARLAPMKKVSIPKLELTAAKVAVDLLLELLRELELRVEEIFLWTDSKTVLKYIGNEKKRFLRFVANKLSFIRQHTSRARWFYTPTDLNPADHISRGMDVAKFVDLKVWKTGPAFLWNVQSLWPKQEEDDKIEDNDPEVKRDAMVMSVQVEENKDVSWILEAFSNWHNLRQWIASLIRFQKKAKGSAVQGPVSLSELKDASTCVFKFEQERAFSKELAVVMRGSTINQESRTMRKLSPLFGPDGLLRVGGRLAKSELPYEVKHPIILPRSSPVSKLLVREVHVQTGHLGHETMLTRLRQRFRILGDTGLAKKEKRQCVTCRKYEARPLNQIMADLPPDRLQADVAPFTNTGLDFFGPFEVKRGRSLVKRYGVIFTCLSSRAIHLEAAHSLDTSSFVEALRRFIARRGNVVCIRCDNGRNFVGGNRELGEAIEEWNQDQILDVLCQKEIEWKYNPPGASHFGGVWEREIRSIRKVLNGLMKEQRVSLNDESFSTLLCEVEAVLNSRPLTALSDDPDDVEALTPNHLLLLRPGVCFPPGLFKANDVYSRRRWRQAQYLSDLFWHRWKTEYIHQLQERRKWQQPQRNVKNGDLVMLTDKDQPRGRWPMARVLEVHPDKRGQVRSATVKTASSRLHRPIAKMILIHPTNDM